MREDGEANAVLVLETLGAPERRRLRGRRGKAIQEADAEPVPTNRATVIRPAPFESPDAAATWLSEVRQERDHLDEELARATAVLNRLVHAHRVSVADPYVRDVAADHALVVRVGIGTGDDVVDGRYVDAWELPRGSAHRVRRSMEAPHERFAALLGGREDTLACEELVLRARSDLDAGRTREAALQARIALEALLAELPSALADRRGLLEEGRQDVGAAANAALQGDLPQALAAAVASSVEQMETALRVRRLGSAG